MGAQRATRKATGGRAVNAYIDIDGVLLREGRNGQELIPHFRRVIKYLVAHFDCYWLTTHVRHESGSAGAVKILAPYLREKRIDPSVLDGIRPTVWRTWKTEAIDFETPFVWLEDNPLLEESRVLQSKGCADSLIAIDLARRSGRLTVRRLRLARKTVLRRRACR